MVFNEEENELREFDHSNNTLDQGNLLRGIDNKTVRRQGTSICVYTLPPRMFGVGQKVLSRLA